MIDDSRLHQSNWKWLGLIFFLLAAFLYLGVSGDPDLGYHLATGEYIVKSRVVPQVDLFSFSLPNYPYVYHSWLTEVLLYLSYSRAGLWGVSIFYSLLAGGAFYFLACIIRWRLNNKALVFSLLVFVPLIASILGLRTHLITFWGLSFLYYAFERRMNSAITHEPEGHCCHSGIPHVVSHKVVDEWPTVQGSTIDSNKGALFPLRKLVFLPPLFVLWANLHGGFILGLGFLGLLLSWEIYQIWISSKGRNLKIKFTLARTVLMGFCLAAPLITPYGWHTYEQALRMGLNSFAAQYNFDWLPLFDSLSVFPTLGVFVSILFLLTVFTNRKTAPKEKFLTTIFFFLTLKSRRYILGFLIITIPLLIQQIELFVAKFKRRDFWTNFPWYLALFTASLLFVENRLIILSRMEQAYASEEIFAREALPADPYPYAAVLWMKENGVPKNLLNNFTWGGYLIWKLPEHKFFIDGRMDNFFIDDKSFAQDYQEIVMLKPKWNELMKKYQINAVLGPPKWALMQALRMQEEWEIVVENESSVMMWYRKAVSEEGVSDKY